MMNTQKIRDDQLDLDFIGNFLSDEESKILYDSLFEQVKWKKTPSGRHNCTYGKDGLEYIIKWGAASRGKTTIRKALDWNNLAELLSIKDKLEEITKENYNICVVQLYPNGSIGIKPHRDREMKLGTTICGVSLGETRTLLMSRGNKKYDLKLNQGSLYIFNPPTNSYWAHKNKFNF